MCSHVILKSPDRLSQQTSTRSELAATWDHARAHCPSLWIGVASKLVLVEGRGAG